MGYIAHEAILVTGDTNMISMDKLNQAHELAKEMFGELVSPLIPSIKGKFSSFLIAPDGSKEGWPTQQEYAEKRKTFLDFLDTLAFDDGSNPIQFALISYDERYHAEVERTNARIGIVSEL